MRRRWYFHTQTCLLLLWRTHSNTSSRMNVHTFWAVHNNRCNITFGPCGVCLSAESGQSGPGGVAQWDGMSASTLSLSQSVHALPGSPSVWSLPPLHIPSFACLCTAQSRRADTLTQSQQVRRQKAHIQTKGTTLETDRETSVLQAAGKLLEGSCSTGTLPKQPRLGKTPSTPFGDFNFHVIIV